MAFDDDDDIPKQPPAQSPEDAQATAEEALEDEAQDFRHFAALQRKNVSASAIRKGEKDFEEHGTKSQASALEQSRRAMEEVLGYTRVHKPKEWARGWYFPDRWVDDEVFEGNEVKTEKVAAERRELHARERVVCVGMEYSKMGRKIRGQGTNQPGWDQVWLLPEEALFLIERGSLDLWWPMAPMSEIFPVQPNGINTLSEAEEEDEYALGVPLSLQAAYSLLVGNEGERGKVSLRNLQVYSNLSRAGFSIMRLPPPTPGLTSAAPTTAEPQQPLWQRLLNLLFPEKELIRPTYGPFVRPGLYRSYDSIYKQLAVVPRHKPTAHPPAPAPETKDNSPFRVQYHVWKPSTANWSKTKPPAPDYHLAVVDAHETSVPTCREISALLDSMAYEPPPATPPGREGPHAVHRRLQHGHRNVLVAVNDHGVINYTRFAEGAFGKELLYKRQFLSCPVPMRSLDRDSELSAISCTPKSAVVRQDLTGE